MKIQKELDQILFDARYLKPIHNNIFFMKLEDLLEDEYYKIGSIQVRFEKSERTFCQWGVCIAVGPEVDPDDIKVGMFVLPELTYNWDGFEWGENRLDSLVYNSNNYRIRKTISDDILCVADNLEDVVMQFHDVKAKVPPKIRGKS